ncbi:MAG: calcineurin-like phosphoesterase family protein [Bacteroidota bacterium]
MRHLLIFLALLVFAYPVALAQPSATGVVFHDMDGDGIRDDGEPGIAEVAVSNGVEVVRTASDGRYTLPASDDMIVFVIKPRHWQQPTTALNLPQFYYIHKPNGSPELDFAGVAPTGPLPASIDFPLYPHPEADAFRAIVFGDPQPYTIEQVDYLANDIIKELIGVENVAFGITMGDIVGDDLDLYQPINEAISAIGVPWYNVYGNHDMNFDATADTLADETFERVYGPPTYAFQVGRAHFIVLDDVIYPSSLGGRRYMGGFRDDQLAFVENYLAHVPHDHLVVFNMHIPIEYDGPTFRHADRDRLFALLADHPHTLSISAHTHMQRHLYFDASTGWAQADTEHHHYNVGTTSGSWWSGIKAETDIPHTMMRDGTPNGYAFLNIDGADYTIDYKVAGRPAAYQMHIHTPRAVAPADTALLSVNVFNGDDRTAVRYRLGADQPWMPLTKTEAVDPYYDLLARRWEDFEAADVTALWDGDAERQLPEFPGTRLPRRMPSTHLWQTALPRGLAPGTYVVEIEATDGFGRIHRDAHTFRVTAE